MIDAHQRAMAHYSNSTKKASAETRQAMAEMQCIYNTAPHLLATLEDMAELVETWLVTEEVSLQAWKEQLDEALLVIDQAKRKRP